MPPAPTEIAGRPSLVAGGGPDPTHRGFRIDARSPDEPAPIRRDAAHHGHSSARADGRGIDPLRHRAGHAPGSVVAGKPLPPGHQCRPHDPEDSVTLRPTPRQHPSAVKRQPTLKPASSHNVEGMARRWEARIRSGGWFGVAISGLLCRLFPEPEVAVRGATHGFNYGVIIETR